MNRLYFSLILCFLCVGVNAQTAFQQDTPEWLVHQFFSAINFPDKAEYFIDEMTQEAKYPAIGEELRGEATVKINEIEKTNLDAVFSVNITIQNDRKDFYCYLKKQDGWKISAIRTFNIPAYYHQLSDSILNDSALHDSTKAVAHSIKLLNRSDEELKEYFKVHYSEFTHLLNAFRSDRTTEIRTILQQLYLSSISNPDKLMDYFFFSILELSYLEAGFIYCPDKSSLPKINPNEFIIIEKVVKDWYLYRRN